MASPSGVSGSNEQPGAVVWPGDLDIYLFNEGRHRRLWDLLGAHVIPAAGAVVGVGASGAAPAGASAVGDAGVGDAGVAEGGVVEGAGIDGAGVRFTVWAPNARDVWVVGDWNHWGDGTRMEPIGSSGIWGAIVGAARPGHTYKYAVVHQNGQTMLKADPMAQQSERPPSNSSVVRAPSTHTWNDHQWIQARSNHPEAPLRVYEVHLESWRHGLHNYVDIAVPLADHVSALGFTHIELLPVAEHPFGGSWGYQVTGYYSPTSRFGTPDEFRAFVDIMHSRRIGVILDWVPAHFPKDEWALARFDGTALYEHADPRQGEHPDWGTHVFNFERNEVRNFLTANALYWMKEFHIDGLRVDAVASMLYLDYSREPGQWVPNRHGGRENLGAIALLQEVNSVVGAEVPGALMIAEESTSWPRVTHAVHNGGLGFTHKWNMGWMHDTLSYFRRDSVHRQWHHNDLTFGLLYAFGERYVLPLSHDEVVHGKGSLLGKMPGDDWQRFANLRALLAWMWAMPGSPLLFMGAEMAPFTEWSESTGLPWHLYDHPPHRGVHELVTTLNACADIATETWKGDTDPNSFQWLEADDALHSIYAFLRSGQRVSGNHAHIICVANFTPAPRSGYRVGAPRDGTWNVMIDTDGHRFGGSSYRGDTPTVTSSYDIPWQGMQASIVVDLPPLGVLWLESTGD